MNGAVQYTTARTSAKPSSLAVSSVIITSYRMLWEKRRQLVALISLPTLLAAVTLCATLQSYYMLLSGFLAAPTARLAGVLFAILIAGAVVWVFLAVLLAAAGASLAEGTPPAGLFGGSFGVAQARLFAAALRFVLLIAAVVAVAIALVLRAERISHSASYVELIWLVAVIAVFVMCVRSGFLLPALALRERHAVLRRASALSRGNFWRIAVIWIALVAAPAGVIFAFGELLLGGWMSAGAAPSLGSAAYAARALARAGSGIPAALMLTAMTSICLAMAGIGSSVAYRQLVDQDI